MTHWCPVCENPGVPVSHDPELEDDGAVSVSRDLHGIEPSHFCSRCPTFFRGRDRYYLTGQHGGSIYGIAVWPHRERHLSIEVGQDGLVVTFEDGSSVLITREDSNLIATDFFRGSSADDIVAWAGRRGFGLKVVGSGAGIVDLVVDQPGPHFILVSTKAWFQANQISDTEHGIYCLEEIGAAPILFPPMMEEAG
jgi:hypothetical protein